MFRDLLSSRWFQGGFAFFLLCVGGSLLYSWHVHRTTEAEFGKTPLESPLAVESPLKNKQETNTAPVDFQPEGVTNTPDENTDIHLSDETAAETTDETEPLDLTDAFLPDDIATLEDPTLAELHSERQELKQRQAELNTMFEDHFASVVGRKLTAADTRHGTLVSGNADGLTESQVIAELEALRSRSENLRKEQVEWRRKYIQHTGKEYPGTEHWVPFVARDPEEVQKLLQYEMGARGWIIVDP